MADPCGNSRKHIIPAQIRDRLPPPVGAVNDPEEPSSPARARGTAGEQTASVPSWALRLLEFQDLGIQSRQLLSSLPELAPGLCPSPETFQLDRRNIEHAGAARLRPRQVVAHVLPVGIPRTGAGGLAARSFQG